MRNGADRPYNYACRGFLHRNGRSVKKPGDTNTQQTTLTSHYSQNVTRVVNEHRKRTFRHWTWLATFTNWTMTTTSTSMTTSPELPVRRRLTHVVSTSQSSNDLTAWRHAQRTANSLRITTMHLCMFLWIRKTVAIAEAKMKSCNKCTFITFYRAQNAPITCN